MEDQDFDDSELIDAKSVHYEICQAKSTGVLPEEFMDQHASQQKQLVGKIFRHYQKTMKGCNAIDFDDILNLTVTLFEEHPEVMDSLTERFRYIMVDEYQDTNHIQYKLLRHLTKRHRNLCVVGDDDQSIYGWRGANVQNILNFEICDFRKGLKTIPVPAGPGAAAVRAKLGVLDTAVPTARPRSWV